MLLIRTTTCAAFPLPRRGIFTVRLLFSSNKTVVVVIASNQRPIDFLSGHVLFLDKYSQIRLPYAQQRMRSFKNQQIGK